jgi:hypothetical protein
MEAAVVRLADVPLTIGGWRGEAVEMDPAEVAQAGISGCWMRRYTNPRDGDQATVLLMCGPAGPLSVHTPELCYGGAGYEMTAGPQKVAMAPASGIPPVEFWAGRFTKEGTAAPEHLRIFWSWSATGAWTAPSHPRLAFGRFPVLYKLYVVRNLTTSSDDPEGDPCLELIRPLLAELARTLFGPRAPDPG